MARRVQEIAGIDVKHARMRGTFVSTAKFQRGRSFAIRCELLSVVHPPEGSNAVGSLLGLGGDLWRSQSYIGTIVTDREQSFVPRAVTRRPPPFPCPPPNVRAALFGALRSLIITITSIFYGANFCSCRPDVSLLGRKREEGRDTGAVSRRIGTRFAQSGRIPAIFRR